MVGSSGTGRASSASASSSGTGSMAFSHLAIDAGGDGVAQHVGDGAPHVEEVVDAEHQQQAGFRQAEHGQHGGDDDQRGARHAGDALGRHHQHQQHGDLGGQRHRDVVGLGDEQRQEGGVHHRAVEVERVAERQHEAGDAGLDAELFQLLHQLGVHRFAARRRETDQHRAAHQLEQAEDVLAEHQVAGADEHGPQHGQRNIEAEHELAEDEQHAQALRGDGAGNRAEDAERGKAHHVVGDSEHHVHHFVHGIDQRTGGLVVQVAEGQAEEDGEDEDLQDFVAGHGFHDALREDVGDEVLEVQRAGLQVEAGGRFRQRHAEGGARLQQVGEEQADEQRAERGADEPAERLGTNAADRLRVAHVGQAGDQGGEDQRGNDHLDQAQEDVGQDAEVAGDFLGRGRRRRQRMAGIADDDAEDHGDADPGGQAIHFHACFLVVQSGERLAQAAPGRLLRRLSTAYSFAQGVPAGMGCASRCFNDVFTWSRRRPGSEIRTPGRSAVRKSERSGCRRPDFLRTKEQTC